MNRKQKEARLIEMYLESAPEIQELILVLCAAVEKDKDATLAACDRYHATENGRAELDRALEAILLAN